jgi:hypothetical protein
MDAGGGVGRSQASAPTTNADRIEFLRTTTPWNALLAVPLNVLEVQINEWIAGEQSRWIARGGIPARRSVA